jgi:hypothetical protein
MDQTNGARHILKSGPDGLEIQEDVTDEDIEAAREGSKGGGSAEDEEE